MTGQRFEEGLVREEPSDACDDVGANIGWRARDLVDDRVSRIDSRDEVLEIMTEDIVAVCSPVERLQFHRKEVRRGCDAYGLACCLLVDGVRDGTAIVHAGAL